MTRNVCFRYFGELFPVIPLLFMSSFFKIPNYCKKSVWEIAVDGK